jgi:hypothetical protein
MYKGNSSQLIIKLEDMVGLLGQGVEISFTGQVRREGGLLLRCASKHQKMEVLLCCTKPWVFKNQSDFSF